MSSSEPRSDGLAPYAADAKQTRGRRYPEAPSATRSSFQRDRDRIIHSTAFRRLAQKTQVFLPDEGDHYRTRLTHTIEVGQITRTLTRALRLDDDLGEALALAHDLGHTPFGHTGEDGLGEALASFGGFDHNAQTVRIVTLLERRYPGFDGLNLSWESIEGLLKRGGRGAGIEESSLAWDRMNLACLGDGDAWSRLLDEFPSASAEAQAAAVADDIAYNAHDLEDGLQAGLFTLEALDAVPILARIRNAILAENPGLPPDLVVRGVARQVVGAFVEDVIAESRARLAETAPPTADAVRALAHPVIGLSPAMARESDAIKRFLFRHMYRHPRLLEMRAEAKRVVLDLARRFLAEPTLLPIVWQMPEPAGEAQQARRVADYIAGMTDRYAMAEHRRLFDAPSDLR